MSNNTFKWLILRIKKLVRKLREVVQSKLGIEDEKRVFLVLATFNGS